MWCEWLGLSFKVIVGSGCGSDCILEGNIGTALFFSGFLFFLFFFLLPFALCECRFSLFEALTKYLALLGGILSWGYTKN